MTKLPEGWERGLEGASWIRRDGATCWANRNHRYSAVTAGLTIAESIRNLVEQEDPIAAMLALNEKYPIDKEAI